eukprot:NODE_6963_length_804_cov_3.505140_g6727_i0.p1 GENE.NODE_6963_length_804_cov_3.505140_g6727_i0~~NODE_6963_length_804_cov_3.505140_g6727_i0.p1  ORF type:complete len:138 (-),score=26.27 NODE_6963_length_804_cov_3.505140_g6727_i0:198-611(-)
MKAVAAAGVSADYCLVYITEAHAQDEWPVGDPLHIQQPVSDAERLGIARQFQRDYKLPSSLPILVDTVQNHFCDGYTAWPIRFFVIDPLVDTPFTPGTCEGTLQFKAQPDGKLTYDSVIPQLQDFLITKYGSTPLTA